MGRFHGLFAVKLSVGPDHTQSVLRKRFLVLLSVSVHSGCCNKSPRAGWRLLLICFIIHPFLTVLKAASPWSRCQQTQCLPRAPILVHRRVSSRRVLRRKGQGALRSRFHEDTSPTGVPSHPHALSTSQRPHLPTPLLWGLDPAQKPGGDHTCRPQHCTHLTSFGPGVHRERGTWWERRERKGKDTKYIYCLLAIRGAL